MRALLSRYPDGEERFFTEAERRHCNGFPDPIIHFAGTFAAKEAVLKAARLGPITAWASRVEILRDASGAPHASIRTMPQKEVRVSISHDADVAVAIAICDPTLMDPTPVLDRTGAAEPSRMRPGGAPLPNPNLGRFLGLRHGSRDPRRPSFAGLTALAECAPGSDFP